MIKLLTSVIFIQIFLVCGYSRLYGQVDTTLHIPTVLIEAATIRSFSVGSQEKTWRKSELQSIPSAGLPELLQSEGVYVKSYGMGSLATSSIRGGSAGHTAVLWNGIPVSSPMLGQLDLSLLPLPAFSSVTLRRGGGSTAWGSGAIGGVVQLESKLNFDSRSEGAIESVLGDFGRIREGLSFKFGSKDFSSRTAFQYTEAQNDFRYFIADDFPKRKQTNAELYQRIFTQDLAFKINPRHQLNLHIYHQDAYREIPPTNVQSKSTAYQEDEADRILFGYSYKQGSWQVNLKTAYFDESIFFADPRTLLESPSSFQTLTFDGSAQYVLNDRHTFLVGQTFSRTEAQANDYEENPIEERWSVFGMWNYRKDDLSVQASFRQEFVNGEAVVPVPALAAEYRISGNLLLKGRISRNFRLPTLNDRFWVPGGNPDLKAESGWSQEATAEYGFFIGKAYLKFEQTVYNRTIDNWIMWNPSGEGYWAASNIASVWSRGTESRVSFEYRSKRIKLRFKAGYDRTASTNEGDLDVAGMDVGEQLLYTPEELAFAAFSAKWKGLTLSYRHNYTGAARGTNELIPAFNTADLRLEVEGKADTSPSVRSSFFFDVMNLYNVDYVVIDRRPMPGINFQAGIRITFSKPN